MLRAVNNFHVAAIERKKPLSVIFDDISPARGEIGAKFFYVLRLPNL
jgi:hypothetical protein